MGAAFAAVLAATSAVAMASDVPPEAKRRNDAADQRAAANIATMKADAEARIRNSGVPPVVLKP